MLKPMLLRKMLTDAVPAFRDDPDKLRVYLEQGNILSTLAPSLSHETHYTLSVIVVDYAGAPDTVFVPILSWLRLHQHDGMANPDRRDAAFRFEVDILSHESCDIEISLAITERTVVSEDDAGTLSVRHVGEPPTPYDRHGPFRLAGVPGSEWTV